MSQGESAGRCTAGAWSHQHLRVVVDVFITLCFLRNFPRRADIPWYLCWARTHAGILHKDIKPENILVADDVLKLTLTYMDTLYV